MSRPRRLAPAALGGFAVSVVLVVAGLVSPAAAAPDAPVVTDLDASVAGTVTATATTDQPFVFAWLGSTPAPQPALDSSSGSAAISLATWGFAGSTTLHVVACPTGTYDAVACSTEAADNVTFTPTDVDVTVTGVADGGSVGVAGITLTVTDPAAPGAGTLQARWQPSTGTPLTTPVDPGVATTLGLNAGLSNGSGTLSVQRCSTDFPGNCADTNAVFSITVRLTVAVTVATPNEITTALPDAQVVFNVPNELVGAYTVTWTVSRNGTTITSSTPAPATDIADGVEFTIPGAGLTANGAYDVAGTLSLVDGEFGAYDIPFTTTLTVDRTGPSPKAITPSVRTIYPRINRFRWSGTTTFTLTAPIAAVTGLEAVRQGVSVRIPVTNGRAVWNGKGNDGTTVVPPGAYTIYATDADLNRSTTTATVLVSGKRLERRTLVKKVSAAGTLVDRFVGSCSQLRNPSARGATGSLGFYSSTTCRNAGFGFSGVSSVHATILPKVDQYDTIRVDTYGGSAARKPGSRAVVRYLTTKNNWLNDTRIGSPLAIHNGPTRTLNNVLFADRSFGWGIVASAGNRYDVINFRVVLTYYMLVN